ncbi:MAG: hypothetical protein KDD94_05155 [Calditrichaeota bacterium]|nr:hypothetical protein [Calditrichota bacterium]
MNRLLSPVLILCLTLLVSCGDLKKEAEEAVKNNDFETAYKNYVELANSAPAGKEKDYYREQAILIDVHRQIQRVESKFSKTLTPLEKRIEKVQELENPSEEFLKGYADVCAKVADTYIAFEGNERVKKENYRKALDILSAAIERYPNSTIANEKYETIVEEEYNEAVAKGDEYYDKYNQNKRKNEDQLIYAESWYAKAQRMRKKNEDLNKKLDDIRKVYISVAEVDETMFFVVNTYQKKDNNYIFKIAIKNNTDYDQEFNVGNFTITMKDGSEVQPDIELSEKLLSKSSVMQNSTLKRYKVSEGTFAVPGADDNPPVKISYSDGTNTAQYKNLPQI